MLLEGFLVLSLLQNFTVESIHVNYKSLLAENRVKGGHPMHHKFLSHDDIFEPFLCAFYEAPLQSPLLLVDIKQRNLSLFYCHVIIFSGHSFNGLREKNTTVVPIRKFTNAVL